MGKYLYDDGSGLAVPGAPEVVLQYGDASTIDASGVIPGAMLINGRDNLEQARLVQVSGLHADPDGRETRDPRADQHGERAGNQLYGGRTVGLTGKTQAGNLTALRDLYEGLRRQFGNRERDLLVSPPRCVPTYANEVPNPTAASSTTGWSSSGTLTAGVVDGDLVVGRSALTGPTNLLVIQCGRSWRGEDVYVGVALRLAAGAVTNTLSLRLAEWDASGSGFGNVVAQSLTNASIGPWLLLSARVPASSINPRTRTVGLRVDYGSATSTSVQILFERATVVMLDQDDPTPASPFDGDTSGYVWDGVAGLSTSRGPVCVENLVADPAFVGESGGLLSTWSASADASGVVNQAPIASFSYRGDAVDRSAYFKVTKDASATSRKLTLSAVDPLGGAGANVPVTVGRSYRLSFSARVLQAPVAPVAYVTWRKYDGSVLSTSATTAMASSGDSDVETTLVAPDQARFATVVLVGVTTTTSATILEAYVSDPCLVDVSDDESAAFFGVGDAIEETSSDPGSSRARRRLRRPFLLRRVRKASDFQESDTQSDVNWRRDWTMSVRAGDPRIYVVDDRRVGVQLTGASSYLARQAPNDFSLEVDNLPVPTGYTYEGQYVTSAGGIKFRWSQEAANWHTPVYGVPTAPISHPNGGVGPRAWDGSGFFDDGGGSNRPTSDLKTRVYRSVESLTYATPRVVLGCAPQGYGAVGDPRRFIIQLGSGSPPSRTFYYNNAAIVLKRIDSSTWLELRWNSYSFAAGNNGETNTTAPHAFELWASHTTGGSASPTLVDSWDYESYDSAAVGSPLTGRYPFDPSVDPMWLVAWEVDDVVSWELWRTYPTALDFGNMIESGSHVLTSGHVARYGDAAAGSTGWSLSIPKATGASFDWETIASRPPFVHYFEASDASLPPTSIVVPAIGSIEMPYAIQLRGDLVDPTIAIEAPGMDGDARRVTTAQLQGKVFDSNPVTISLYDDFSVVDSDGVARDDLLVVGSDFSSLTPGLNRVTLQARGWGSYPEHMSLTWKDALR